MKRSFKSFAVGFLCGTLLLGSIPAMASTVRELSASFNGIKITLDGQEIVPTDALGNPVEPFVVDGTTYLPVRAVASAVGLDVAWDGETQTVVLKTPGAVQPDAEPAEDTTPETEIFLSAGNYFAGVDFPAGTYDIVAVSGGGNVLSSNFINGGINAVLGDESYTSEYGDFYQRGYKNIRLPEGTELRIMSSLVVQLIPKN